MHNSSRNRPLPVAYVVAGSCALFAILVLLVLAGCAGLQRQSAADSSGTNPQSPAPPAAPPSSGATGTTPPQDAPSSLISVLTREYDNARTGANLNETVLTPQNVNSSTFGKIFSYSYQGDTYAQPLYVPNVAIPGQGTHNVIYVATEHDVVYAFDADGKSQNPLWVASFINPNAGINPVNPATDFGRVYEDIRREIGITGTPVIDPASGTLYVVAKTNENGTFFQRLHALDITTGQEKFGGPVAINPSIPGNATKNDGNGNDIFDPLICNQRAGLLLLNGTVYVAFASHGDFDPFLGWIVGFDAQTLKMTRIFSPVPDDDGGAIWQSGGGLAADSAGNIYASVGNGGFNANTGGRNYGDSFVKLSTAGNQLTPVDYFAPFDQQLRNDHDKDLGSGGIMLVPDQSSQPSHLLIGGDKEGLLFVINRDAMGQFNANDNSNAVQTVTVNPGSQGFTGVFGSPAYWNGHVYIGAVNSPLESFTLAAGQLTLNSQTSTNFSFPGVTPVVSAKGNSAAIVWTAEVGNNDAFDVGDPAILHAYDANNVATELYNSTMAGSRDTAPGAVKFTIPTIANGKVYMAGRDGIAVYGLLPH